ncbi:YebC/PmpR family DNA-binding transcriptional regulator, partial [bacterium]|nr:YebC/PmpR family DNA-binding transcriptional regulator [bacterium]
MAGHSKWKNIQHRKGAQDAKRGQIFTRLIREITIAARQSPDTSINPRLRAAVDKALDNNMSKDTIQKAINKGAGLDGAAQLIEVVYEGYGPGGVAFIVECATDNKNRTVPEIRHLFTKAGGSLGTTGSVSYLFDEVGTIELESTAQSEELFDLALDLGVRDIEENEDAIVIECEPNDLFAITESLKQKNFKVLNSQKNKIPHNYVPWSLDLAEKITILYDKFD